jgi:hypothetical protein
MSRRVLHLAATLALSVALAGGIEAAAYAASPSSTTSARQMRAVVHAWSTRLNKGDNAGVARLFAVPAIMIQGPYAYRLVSRAQLAKWHAGLPCSGRIVSISIRGRFATAVFRLGDRPTSKCDAPGTLAAARFEIVRGKIVLWQQVAVPAKKEPGSALAS